MQKTFTKAIFIFILLTGYSFTTNAQRFFVRVRPVAPVVARPLSPGGGFVWVAGDWLWQNNAYRWRPGYWMRPPRPRAIWITGRWARNRRGSCWIPGYWRM